MERKEPHFAAHMAAGVVSPVGKCVEALFEMSEIG